MREEKAGVGVIKEFKERRRGEEAEFFLMLKSSRQADRHRKKTQTDEHRHGEINTGVCMCVREGERYQETWREGGKTERLTKN